MLVFQNCAGAAQYKDVWCLPVGHVVGLSVVKVGWGAMRVISVHQFEASGQYGARADCVDECIRNPGEGVNDKDWSDLIEPKDCHLYALIKTSSPARSVRADLNFHPRLAPGHSVNTSSRLTPNLRMRGGNAVKVRRANEAVVVEVRAPLIVGLLFRASGKK